MSERGAQDFARLARQLRETGNRGLQREFSKAITKALKPLRKVDLPESAMRTLPRRGGVNQRVAKTKYTISRKTGNATQGLRLNAKHKYNLLLIDKGFLRHPVFKRRGEEGRRTVWQTQRVTPGWFSEPAKESQPAIQQEINEAMEAIVNQITEGL